MYLFPNKLWRFQGLTLVLSNSLKELYFIAKESKLQLYVLLHVTIFAQEKKP